MKKQAAKRAAGEAEEEETFPDPMHKGDLTVEELRRYDGSNPTSLCSSRRRVRCTT